MRDADQTVLTAAAARAVSRRVSPDVVVRDVLAEVAARAARGWTWLDYEDAGEDHLLAAADRLRDLGYVVEEDWVTGDGGQYVRRGGDRDGADDADPPPVVPFGADRGDPVAVCVGLCVSWDAAA